MKDTDKPIKLKPNMTQEELEKTTAGLRMLINENHFVRQMCHDAYFLLTGGTLFEELVKEQPNFPTLDNWIDKYENYFPDPDEESDTGPKQEPVERENK
jgi:hypothetical protein